MTKFNNLCIYEGSLRIWDPRTNQVFEACLPPCAKEKGDYWFGTSKGRKAIHTEIEKQIFGEQMFSGTFLTM